MTTDTARLRDLTALATAARAGSDSLNNLATDASAMAAGEAVLCASRAPGTALWCLVRCETCYAPVYDQCQTASGKRSSMPHSERFRAGLALASFLKRLLDEPAEMFKWMPDEDGAQ